MATAEPAERKLLVSGTGIDTYEEFYRRVHKMDCQEGIRFWRLFSDAYFADYISEEKDILLKLTEFYARYTVVRALLNNCLMIGPVPEVIKDKLTLARLHMERMEEMDFVQIIKGFEG